jgi:hypothetical protein
VTTALFGWAKGYVSSPAFKTQYIRIRAEAKTMPAAEQANILAQVEEAQSQLKNPAMRAVMRAEKEEERARDAASVAEGLKGWAVRFPADPNAFSVVVLRNFLAGTADVDYSAKIIEIEGEGGSGPGFANEALRQKPWMWVECGLADKDAVMAARAAAPAWLKELGG